MTDPLRDLLTRIVSRERHRGTVLLDADELCAIETALAQAEPLTPEWIWSWLMDWCKQNGTSPANYDSLFKMVSDARAAQAEPRTASKEATMTDKPEALFLADAMNCVSDDGCGHCMPCRIAAELRRLAAIEAEREALREVLKSTGVFLHYCWGEVHMNDYSSEKLNQQMAIVDAAIAKVKGGGNV